MGLRTFWGFGVDDGTREEPHSRSLVPYLFVAGLDKHHHIVLSGSRGKRLSEGVVVRPESAVASRMDAGLEKRLVRIIVMIIRIILSLWPISP